MNIDELATIELIRQNKITFIINNVTKDKYNICIIKTELNDNFKSSVKIYNIKDLIPYINDNCLNKDRVKIYLDAI